MSTAGSSPRADGAVAAVRALAEAHRIDPSHAGVLREGTSVLVELPAAEVVVRVDDAVPPARAARQVAVARALARAGVPATRLAVTDDQPLTVPVGEANAAVTLWRREHPVGRAATPREMGTLARRLHDATADGAHCDGVPPLAPLSAIASQTASAAGAGTSPPADLSLLTGVRERLEATWPGPDAGGVSLVHGDLHVDNVIVTEDGALLCDLELAGVGPSAYDLVPAVVAVERYGAPVGDLSAFEEGYGRALPPAARRGPLVETYELWVTVWAVANRGLDEAHEAEARRRLARWGDTGDLAARERWVLR